MDHSLKFQNIKFSINDRFFSMDDCAKDYPEKGLHFHLRIKEFLSDLAKEIVENGNLPDSWKMAIRYGLPEVMQAIKVSFQQTPDTLGPGYKYQ